MSGSQIRYGIEAGIGLITLDAPATRNALSREMAGELLELLPRAEKEVAVLVITGAGSVFSSGANLGGFDLEDPERDVGWGLETFHNPLMRAVETCQIPVITAVNGPAIGVGAAFALIGDLIFAAENAFFRFGFQRVGLAPDGGATWLLGRAIGRVRTMELVLTGRDYPAAEALRDGLITAVLPAEQLLDRAMAQAAALAQFAPQSLAMARREVWAAASGDYAAQLQRDRDNQRIAGRSAAFAEGVRAFREKRAPVFRPQSQFSQRPASEHPDRQCPDTQSPDRQSPDTLPPVAQRFDAQRPDAQGFGAQNPEPQSPEPQNSAPQSTSGAKPEGLA